MGAALKGLGHAAGATAEEAGRAAQAGMGLKPPSPHSIDTRGRPVENLGTRAANSLQIKAQQEREERVASSSHQKRPNEASGTGDDDSTTRTSSDGTSGFRDPQRPSTDRRLIPPKLPPDTPPPSSVSIRFETDD